jgi:hypothetical protein
MATKAVVTIRQPTLDERKKAQEARELANIMVANNIARFISEFHIDDVVV